MPLLLRSEKKEIDFFSNAKFPYMTTEHLYSYNNGKYIWGGCGKLHGMLFQLFSLLNYAVKYMWARLYRKKHTF